MSILLCHIDEIPEAGAFGIDLAQAKLFAIKKRGEVFLYLNRCPHLGVQLNWQPHGFLAPDKAFIQCSFHGALFELKTGSCVQGPCAGRSLLRIDYTLVDGQLHINEGDLPVQPAPA